MLSPQISDILTIDPAILQQLQNLQQQPEPYLLDGGRESQNPRRCKSGRVQIRDLDC